jgi:WD40 repeat protein
VLASTSADGTIWLWNDGDGSLSRTLQDHRGEAKDVATGYLLRTIKVQTHSVWEVAFGPDGVHLAAAGTDGSLQILDVTRDQESRR